MEKYIKPYKLFEASISPSTEPDTLSLWHGGDLEKNVVYKKGRSEYGPGLYLTTAYNTAIGYAKGSRKLYIITIEKGVDIRYSTLYYDDVCDFVESFVIKSKQKEILTRIDKYVKNDQVSASIFLNIMINEEAVLPRYYEYLRNFLVDNDIDYSIEDNAFGYNERMIVLFNMNKIIKTVRVFPNDKIEVFDLSKEFA